MESTIVGFNPECPSIIEINDLFKDPFLIKVNRNCKHAIGQFFKVLFLYVRFIYVVLHFRLLMLMKLRFGLII